MNSLQKLLFISLLASTTVFADGSQTASKGSDQVSDGSINIGKGAAELFAESAQGLVNFTVESIEVAGDSAEIILVSAVEGAKASGEVSITVAASSLTALAIAAGTTLQLMEIYAETKEQLLGYTLLDGSRVVLFVSAEGASLTITSDSL